MLALATSLMGIRLFSYRLFSMPLTLPALEMPKTPTTSVKNAVTRKPLMNLRLRFMCLNIVLSPVFSADGLFWRIATPRFAA